jgi:Ca2+-transporting ATPase
MRRESFPFWRDVIKLCIQKKLWSEFPMETNLTGSEEPSNFWHNLTGDEAVAALETDRSEGLHSSEIANRVTKFGPNELKEAPPKSIWAKLWAQFNDFTIWLLIGAAIISAVLGEWIEAGAILAIVILSAGNHPGAAG